MIAAVGVVTVVVARYAQAQEPADQKASAKPARKIRPKISLTYQTFFPSGARARSIFGHSPSNFGLSLFGSEGGFGVRLGKNTRLGFMLDTLDVRGDNKLFVLSPRLAYEFRVPSLGAFVPFARVSAGPAYFDYSFNDPSGRHLGAKRLGGSAGLSAGVRLGAFQVDAQYRVFTEPAGVSLNGFSLGLSWTVLRF